MLTDNKSIPEVELLSLAVNNFSRFSKNKNCCFNFGNSDVIFSMLSIISIAPCGKNRKKTGG